MTTAAHDENYQPRLEKLARSRKYDKLETEWTAAVEAEYPPFDDMRAALKVLAERQHQDKLESLLWFLISDYAESRGAAAAMQVLLKLTRYLPTSPALREEVAGLYAKVHAANAEIDGMIAMTIRQQAVPLAKAVALVEKMLGLPHGHFVYDERDKRAGKVIGLDAEAGALRVCLGGDEEKAYDAAALDHLTPVDEHDLRALKVFDRDRLQALAHDDPEALMRFVLETFGGRMDYREWRPHVIDILGKGGWTKWWSQARERFKRSPMIQMTDERQPMLVLRRTAVSYEDQFRSRMRAAGSRARRLELALDYLEHAEGGAEAHPDLLDFIIDTLQADAETGTDDSPGRLAATLVLISDVRAMRAVPDANAIGELKDILGDPDSLPALLADIDNDNLAIRVLAFARREFPEDWTILHGLALPECTTAVCAAVAQGLVQAGAEEPLLEAVDKVLARPARYMGALIWLWRAWCSDWAEKVAGLQERLDPTSLVISLVTGGDAVKRNAQGDTQAAQKALLADIRTALALKNYKPTIDAVERGGEAKGRILLDALNRDVALTEQARGMLHRIVERQFPGLYVEHMDPWEEECLYTTPEGLEKRRAELAVLTNEKIPANARAIGEAAAKGDLSENAEWSAAIEERERLTERAAHMEAEVSKARFIDHDLATRSRQVTIGSTVKARNLATGKTETYTFLGPWDTDIDNGIIAYRSPLGLAFMGREVGEEAAFDLGAGERRWEIVGIE